MLLDLAIRDILLIEELELAFGPGLNVLTGETGAGKSILLDSLGFVLGWRGRAEIVRQGATEGEVTAVFDLPADHPAHAILAEAGLPGDDQLILRRINTADGRKRGFVNDRRASGEVLRALSDTLVELHGQHDDKGLLDPRNHRLMLDAFGGLDGAREATRSAWRAWRAAAKALEDAQTQAAEAARDADYLRHSIKELDALDPRPGEETELDTRRRQMQMAERIREDVARAVQAMGAEGATGRLSDAMRWLEGTADRAEGALDGAIEALGRALIELGEAEHMTEDWLSRMAFDTAELERIEERLFAIRGLARKHAVLPDELGDFAAEMRARLALIDNTEGEIAARARAATAARVAYDAAAAALGDARRMAAGALDTAMAAELPDLRLEAARFETGVMPLPEGEEGPDGTDRVAFSVATNPGAPAGPINRIASGGELSRFLLALKVCLAKGSPGQTMIFDEIDRGVGGATADAVGRRLARVAEGAQVLVVTHAPQVAARGAHHFRVTKSVLDGATRTEVDALDPVARIAEIARMLAGDTVTDEARSAARALLAG